MNTMLIGIGIVCAFVIWKYVMQPIMNEGKPIEPPKDFKTIPEQIEEATKVNTNTEVDF